MLPGGGVIDGQGCIRNALATENATKFKQSVLYFRNGCASKAPYLFDYSVGFGHAFPQIDRLMSQSVRDVPFDPLGVSLIGDRRHHVIGSLSCCLKRTHATNIRREDRLYWSEWKGGFTWMVRTILLVSSRAAMAVDVPKEAVPLWNPRTIRPSFLYCSMGSQTKSLNP